MAVRQTVIKPTRQSMAAPMSITQEAALIAEEYARYEGRQFSSRHYPICLALQGDADGATALRAWTGVVGRHAALRTRFQVSTRYADELRCVQLRAFRRSSGFVPGLYEARVDTFPDVRMDCSHVETSSDAKDRAAVAQLAHQSIRRVHELDGGPRRAMLVTTRRTTSYFVALVSHLVADGWAARMIERDFMRTYHSLRSGSQMALHAGTSFETHVSQEREWLLRGNAAAHVDYWERQWAVASSLQLRRDELRLPLPPAREERGVNGVTDCVVPAAAATEMRAYIEAAGISSHSFFRTALSIALCALSGRTGVSLWGNFINRRTARVRAMVGAVATRHLLAFEASATTCAEACARVDAQLAQSQQFEALPLAGLLLRLGVPRVPNDTSITFDSSWPPNDLPSAGAVVQPVLLRPAIEWVDLDIRTLVSGDRIQMSATYNPGRYTDGGVQILLRSVIGAATVMANRPSTDVRACIDAVTDALVDDEGRDGGD